MDLQYRVNGQFLSHVLNTPGIKYHVHIAIIYVLLPYYGIKKISSQ
jgi:hypothetical protein